MLKENKREEITKNIEKREALVEQVADGIWQDRCGIAAESFAGTQ